MKPVTFHSNALERIREFPDGIQDDLGYQIETVQKGEEPSD
jgi:phage-related protein